MPPSFLTPPIELLGADGRLTPVARSGGLGRPIVVLARELCAFELFEPRGASGSAGLAAARLYARTNSPFLAPGLTIRRGPRGFGLWWWDMEAVSAMLADRFGAGRLTLVPESLAQARGEGWRMLRQSSGYEAQLWRDGELVGSSWGRERFDEAGWADFVRVQRHGGEDAPVTPPQPQTLPLQPSMAAGSGGLKDLTPGETAALAAGVAAVLLVAATAFELGQGMQLRRQAKAAETEAAAVRAQPVSPAAARDRKALRELEGFRALSDRPNTLASLTAALEVLRLFDVEAQGYETDGRTLTLTLPYSAIDKAERMTAELAGTGRFSDIRPVTLPGRKALQLRMTVAGARAG